MLCAFSTGGILDRYVFYPQAVMLREVFVSVCIRIVFVNVNIFVV